MGNLTYRDFRLHLDKAANRYTVSLPFSKAADYVAEPEDWDASPIGEAILDLMEELAGDSEPAGAGGNEITLSSLYRDKALDALGAVGRPVELEELLAVAAHWYNAGFEAGRPAADVS